ncbi:MAG: ribose 1,5-bisphosphate isomerase [Methanocorpusculum sp.]|jgi:ribose 1,5-bisphosphate isomerase|nr:ribose 1,5-bisphosphate isomerase [Methanocorpusculum sp.]MDD2471263.1 ribose 1,5-bisphosphate isomerase [Methanocorpusculum sp.]MDD3257412.1 ribose 1,5-bisphosphate isomerase [Methanocorpusculum sp.]MDD4133391.1 ribose 1,5-bisphosphate isomerase [Methanocorpusculum sp.]
MSINDTAEKIISMEIRGAGKIAREAVSALRDHAESLPRTGDATIFIREMEQAAGILLATRPTAVSLPNAIQIVLRDVRSSKTEEAARCILREKANEFIWSSRTALNRISAMGANHIPDGSVIMTHCNSGAALGSIIEAKRQGKDIEVYATEVRPWNQGRITIKTLNDNKIPTTFIVDSAVRTMMKEVDLVIVGADAITVNGSVVNKIGTSQIALCAHEARKNVIVTAETFKFAPRTILGELIQIEERPTNEVLPDDIAAALPYVKVRNPVFDVTPAEYIDMIITEAGAIPPHLAYTIMREYLGWGIEELQNQFLSLEMH